MGDLLATLDAQLAKSMDVPELARAYSEARARYERAVARLCPFGNCEVLVDPIDRTVQGGMGPVGCGCDNLPGWRSRYYDGLPKPGWQAKPVGRHGGRIAASRRKHAAWRREATR